MPEKSIRFATSSRLAKCGLALAAFASLTGMQGRLSDFDDRLLASHNRERDLHGVPALVWDNKLARGAEQWATHLARTGKFEHSPDDPERKPEGENIWGGTKGAFDPEAMIGLWVAEKKHFQPGRFPYNSLTQNVADVSHFTQVVWRKTGKVGCGLAANEKREILVCRYSRPGNIIGRDVF
ncbi:CAP family protein [Qipengyuania gelatinilytica]|uniref:CAP family protein n=1 Tax=Qipengyuania gelatinilytica TaxID=2867231 RepID=A0ABX9A1D2_9SPHN|nr:CAP family protein [Qipengyuania gelatinilytica]QZD95072.1 CAP family protein [Qipengyuania gelatinilytica]